MAERRIEATTTIEVVQAFVHVRARRRGRADASAPGRDYAELLSPLLGPTGADLRQGLDWYGRSERVGAFDAVLAATALAAGARALVSADGAFADIAAIAHVMPDAAGVAGLLGG